MQSVRTRFWGGGRAFSLVELLVVIGVIAMLTALLLPALQKAKDTAKSIDCQGRLKQMVLGMAGYTGDNNEWYPYRNVGDWQTGTTCFEAMDSYVFGTDNPGKRASYFYSCPADLEIGKVNLRMCYAINQQRNGSSGLEDGILNRAVTIVGGVTSSGQPCRTSQVQDFAGTFLFACYGNTLRYIYPYTFDNCISMDAPYDAWGWTLGLLHNKGMNWGFCDGHSGWMRWQDSVGKGDQTGPKGIWTRVLGD